MHLETAWMNETQDGAFWGTGLFQSKVTVNQVYIYVAELSKQ